MNHLLAQIQDLQDKVSSLTDARGFYDPETASSSGATHVPSRPLLFRVLEESSAAILACRLIHGIHRVPQETFLSVYLLEKDHSHSSRRHHLLADGDQVIRETLWNMEEGETRSAEFFNTDSTFFNQGS